jgi:hypothetical protein
MGTPRKTNQSSEAHTTHLGDIMIASTDVTIVAATPPHCELIPTLDRDG